MKSANPGTTDREEIDSSADQHMPFQLEGVVPFRGPADTRPAAEQDLPDRYEIRGEEEGVALRCREAPGVAVRIDASFAFSETEAKKLGERVILLDGAGQFGPLLDDARHLYNLDHHEGCLRAFTLATCEQALILVLKGVGLDRGDWTIYANEPDLDTVFAIWVLLNYRRVRELTPEARDAIVPLLRLEGAIDANGFEIAEVCGLPQTSLSEERSRLERLYAIEREAKQSGSWSKLDGARYTHEMLLAIDRMVYTSGDFADYASIELEYGHVDIGENRVAVVCRDGAGIYDVERRLRKVWGERLGIIALERAPQHYTLRRVASLAGILLEDSYRRLNLLDPAVDGRPPKKRWGGSDDIGGSPRPHGTGLTPREIAKILKLTYQEVRPWHGLQRFSMALVWTAVLTAAAGAAVWGWLQAAGTAPEDAGGPQAMLVAALIAGFGAWALTHRLSRGWTWLFGWRWPAAEDWLVLVPVAWLGAGAGGVWVPRDISFEAEPLAVAALAMLFAALALALWFPGLVHGLLILEAPVQTVRSRWFISLPALASAVLYTAVTTLACLILTAGPSLPLAPPWGLLALVAGAFLCGLSVAMIRERSLSLWPAVGALAAGCVVRLIVDAVSNG